MVVVVVVVDAFVLLPLELFPTPTRLPPSSCHLVSAMGRGPKSSSSAVTNNTDAAPTIAATAKAGLSISFRAGIGACVRVRVREYVVWGSEKREEQEGGMLTLISSQHENNPLKTTGAGHGRQVSGRSR